MNALFRSLLAWLAIGVTAFLLATFSVTDTFARAPLWITPALAVAFTVWSFRTPAQRRIWRIGWWVVALLGWGAATLAAQAKLEAIFAREDQPMVAVSMVLGLGLVTWLVARSKPINLPLGRTLAEALAGIAVLLGAVFLIRGGYEFETGRIATKAEARWTEIGRPMADFEKTMVATPEGASLPILGRVMKEQVEAPLYKSINPPFAYQPQPAVDSALSLMAAAAVAQDDVDLHDKPTALLDARDAGLSAAYSELLAAEPAIWAANPEEGVVMRVPNFLGLRLLSQLFAGDAIRRFARQDVEGAGLALAATRRASEGLGENPCLVSLMIRVAIDALASQWESRLPEDPAALERIANDALQYRQQLSRSIQTEAWNCLRFVRTGAGFGPENNWGAESLPGYLPRWARKFANAPFLRRMAANSAVADVEQVVLLENPLNFSNAEERYNAMEAIFKKHPTSLAPNTVRSDQRIIATLLLREQSALLRMARARLALHEPLESYPSKIIPGCKWQFSVQAEANIVSLTLSNLPKFLGDIAPNDFWILPPDGSKAWRFRLPNQTASLLR